IDGRSRERIAHRDDRGRGGRRRRRSRGRRTDCEEKCDRCAPHGQPPSRLDARRAGGHDDDATPRGDSHMWLHRTHVLMPLALAVVLVGPVAATRADEPVAPSAATLPQLAKEASDAAVAKDWPRAEKAFRAASALAATRAAADATDLDAAQARDTFAYD